MFRAIIAASVAVMVSAQWGAEAPPPCESCGNHFDPHHVCEFHGTDECARAHFIADQLSPEKEYAERIEDYNARSFGMDRYRTEGQYDSLDRLDSSIKMLNDRRRSQAGALA